MKKVFQKLKSPDFILYFLMILMMLSVAILGLNMSESYAQVSTFGGTSNNLETHGGGIFGKSAVSIGLAVLSGNAGIGTASPTQKLQVSGNISIGAYDSYLFGATTNGALLSTSPGVFNIRSGSASLNVDNNAGSTNLLTIMNAGNVGIGTNNPVQKLHVQGSAYFSDKVGIGVTSPGSTAKLDISGDGGIVVNNTNTYGVGIQAAGYWGVFAQGTAYGVRSQGKIYTDSDLETPNNVWGTCADVTTGLSCSTNFTLTCPEGRFVTSVTNVATSYECVKTIRCCQL